MKKSIFQNRAFACCAAVFCTMLWGTAFPFIKLGYERFGINDADTSSKLMFAGLRFLIAGMMTLLFFAVSSRRFPSFDKASAASVAALGLVQTFAQYFFTYIGIGFTSGTNTSVITACASFVTVLAAPLFFRSDRYTPAKLLGCVMGFGGVLIINRGGGLSADTLFGDSMIFISTLAAAFGNIISKKAASGRNPVLVTGCQLVLGAVCLIAAGLIAGLSLDLANAWGLLILLWLSTVSAVAFTIWTTLLKYHPAAGISVFNLLVPVFGTLLSGILLGENVFRLETLLSLALISAGIIMVNLNGKRNGGKEND